MNEWPKVLLTAAVRTGTFSRYVPGLLIELPIKLIAMVRVSLLEPQYWVSQLTHKNRTSAQTRFVPEVIRAL